MEGWVFEANLRPFLVALGWVVGYPFDPDDWVAVSFGVRASDGEAGRWYEYELYGRLAARLRLARDPGSAVVQVRVDVPGEVEPQVEIALAIFSRFHLGDGAARPGAG